MQSQNQRFASIFHLLWDGKKSEAKTLINSERDELSSKRIIIAEQLAGVDKDLELLDTILPPAKSESADVKPHHNTITAVTAAQHKQDSVKKNLRDSAILEAARALGVTGQHFTTMDVANIVTANGIDMVIAENRYSTAISRLLSRNGRFERVGSGIFKANNE